MSAHPNALHFANNASKQTIHFYHANGFPAGTYAPILSRLNEQFEVYALKGRATMANDAAPSHRDWEVFADDLIELIEELGKPIIAIGHSMGASSTILAANKRPDLFKAVVLIEPAMVSFPISILLKLIPQKILARTKLIKGTLNKKDNWSNPQEYLNYIKRFQGYKGFHAESFDAFYKHAIVKDKGRYQLSFPKQWEAHNYTIPPYLIRHLAKLDQLGVPTVAIRGKANLFFTDGLWKSWKAAQKQAVFLQHKAYSHLFPMEGPEDCIELINAGLLQLKLFND
jgi:pimeloyl-ACP methyl ester carboxylesterase